jgi:hypothetical protein
MARRSTPAGAYVIHREDLAPADVDVIEGVPVVTLSRAIRECARDGVALDLLEQALRAACSTVSRSRSCDASSGWIGSPRDVHDADGDEIARRPKRPKTKARARATDHAVVEGRRSAGRPPESADRGDALADALVRVVDPDGEAVFATKGGIAMELWMGGRARATRDIDIVLRGDPNQLAERLDAALREPYNGFTFRRGEIGELPFRPDVRKVNVQISFAGRILSSPRLEITSLDTGYEEFVAIPAIKLDASASTVQSSCSQNAGRSPRSCTRSPSSSPTVVRTHASATSSTYSSSKHSAPIPPWYAMPASRVFAV